MKCVIVGVDFSPLARKALNAALEIASSRPETNVHAVHVAKSIGPMLRLDLEDDERAVTQAEAETFLRQYVDQYLADSPNHSEVRTHIRTGTPSAEIVQLAAELDADVIVVGTEGRTGVERFLLGSVAENVVRQAGCAVWVVREKAPREEEQ